MQKGEKNMQYHFKVKAAVIMWAVLLTITPKAHAESGITNLPFASDPTWGVFNSDPANGVTKFFGFAQNVCLNSLNPQNCPAEAMLYEHGGGWGADLSLFPEARWIWAPGISGATYPALPARFFFSKAFILAGTPTEGTISVAADDYAKVFVNGIAVGTVGSVTDGPTAVAAQSSLTSFDVTEFLIAGLNIITVRASNGPFGCGRYAYSCNPAGVVFCGSLTFKKEILSQQPE
jgi:hypothetical protein